MKGGRREEWITVQQQRKRVLKGRVGGAMMASINPPSGLRSGPCPNPPLSSAVLHRTPLPLPLRSERRTDYRRHRVDAPLRGPPPPVRACGGPDCVLGAVCAWLEHRARQVEWTHSQLARVSSCAHTHPHAAETGGWPLLGRRRAPCIPSVAPRSSPACRTSSTACQRERARTSWHTPGTCFAEWGKGIKGRDSR